MSVSGEITYGGLQTIRSNCSPGDRLEQVPLAELDPVGAVQHGVEGGEPQRARVDVDRRDLLGVPRGEQRLVAVARAEVERPLDRPREPSATRAPEPAARRRARDPVVASSFWNASQAISRSSVGTSSMRRPSTWPPATVSTPIASSRSSGSPRERRLGVGRGHVEVEQEELDQRRERPAALEHVQVERQLRRVAPARDLGRERVAHAAGVKPASTSTERSSAIPSGSSTRGPPRPLIRAAHCASIVRHVPSARMMSGHAPVGARLAGATWRSLALLLPAAAAAAPAASVGLSNVHLKRVWNQGWLTGNLHFTVTVERPGERVRPSVRPVAPGPGRGGQALHVHEIRLGGRDDHAPAAARAAGLRRSRSATRPRSSPCPTPPEGVVDTAVVSTTQGGKSRRPIPSTTHVALGRASTSSSRRPARRR